MQTIEFPRICSNPTPLLAAELSYEHRTDTVMKKAMVGAMVCAFLLSGCGTDAQQSSTSDTSEDVSRDVLEARAGFQETPGMTELFEDLYRQGFGTTVNEVFALGIYIPGYCETRDQQNLNDDEAVEEVAAALGETYGSSDGERWAAPIVEAAETHVCGLSR